MPLILLVEDANSIRLLLRQVLEKNGYKVLEAGDGVEALEAEANCSEAIDLLLTDVVMPRLPGPALAARFAQLRPQAKLIYMSGYTDDPLVHAATKDGVPFLQKPFTPSTLVKKVREVLAQD